MQKPTIGVLKLRKWNMCLSLSVLLLLLSTNLTFAQNQTIGAGLEGQTLINFIQQNYTPSQVLGYNNARDTMYAVIDNKNGNLTGVYTGFTISINPNVDPSTDAFNKGVNAEHTWPQSMGAGSEPAKSDLHHIFPAKSNVNSARNNDPLGEIDDNLTDTWYYQGQSQTTKPTSNIDLYAENYGSTAFEPREQHKGNAARAIFYFVAIYQTAANQSFFDQQKEDLFNWHYLDGVDADELARSTKIASYQGNENPFVLDTSLVRRAFFPNGNGGTDSTPPVISSVQSTSVGANSATITWTTNEMATSTVDYGTTTSYGSVELNGSYTTAHSVSVTGLTASTTYNYQVSSTDPSSNSNSSANYTFTTTASGGGTGAGAIVFSEIFYDTPGTDSDEEWVELYNGTSSTVDLAGYSIIDNNGAGSSYIFPVGSSIAPNSYFTVATKATGFNAIYGYDADLYGSIAALNNGGDALILKDSQNNEIDAVAWEGGASGGVPSGWGSASNPIASTGESIYRSSVTTDTDTYTDWAVATGNGDPQTQAMAPAVDYVLFSEVFYDTPGTDSDEEWIELYNPTTQAVNISGYAIVDNNGSGASYTFPTGSSIEAESYFTVAVKQTGFNALYSADAHQYGSIPSLNNTGDALVLKDATGTTIDQVAWEGGATGGVPTGWGTGPAASTGESIFRSDMSADSDTDADWSIAANNGTPSTIPLADTTPPTIGSVVESGITETEATITWTTDELATSQINYGTTTGYGSSAGSSNYTTTHSVTLTGLNSGTEYFYQIVSLDEAGNTATAGNHSLTTTSPPASNLPDILITEVFYDTPGTESKEEWIEIYNTTSQQIALNGWSLVDNNGSGSSFTFTSSHTIAGNTYLTLARNSKGFKKLYGKNADDYVTFPALNNGGDALLLLDPSNNVIDAVGWEGGASGGVPTGWGSSSNPVASEGHSIYRSSITTDSDTYSDWATSSGLGSPMTQADGTFFAKTIASNVGETLTESLPDKVSLGNYPNPFNPTTQIAYALPESQKVTITVYNMLGQQVVTLVNGFIKAGNHTVSFDASNLSSGVYLYSIRTPSTMITKKMLLMK